MYFYSTYLLRGGPVLIAVILGAWLARKRWQQNPEACSRIVWGCGLILSLELARVGFWNWFSHAMMETRLADAHQRSQISSAFTIFIIVIYAFSIWTLLRGGLHAIDTTGTEGPKLSAGEIDSILPLVRVDCRLFGSRVFVLDAGGISVGELPGEALGESTFRDPECGSNSTTRFDFARRRNGADGDIKVSATPIGWVGPGRHWRKLRIECGSRSQSFSIPLKDFANVRDALNSLLAEPIAELRPRRTAVERMLLAATILFIGLGLGLDGYSQSVPNWRSAGSEKFISDSISGLYTAAAIGPLVILIAYLFYGWFGSRSKLLPAVQFRKARSAASGLAPFRSGVLGWSLKLAGFIYTLWLFGLEHSDFPEPIWPILIIPCGASIFIGHRLAQRTFLPDSHPDERSPFLFLRSFDDDDKKSLQPDGVLARVHGLEVDFGKRGNRGSILQFAQSFHPARWLRAFLGLPTDTVEEVLAIAARGIGPLVAIGQPGEKSAGSGADRMYVRDDRWQQVVHSYIAKSAGIIIQPSLTDGVLWEIEQVFRKIERRKLLLSMVNFTDRCDDYERFWIVMKLQHGVELPRSLPYSGRNSFLFFTGEGRPVLQPVLFHPMPLWPLTGNAVDIQATLRAYFDGLGSMNDSTSIAGAPPSTLSKLASLIVLGLVFIALLVALPAATSWICHIAGFQ